MAPHLTFSEGGMEVKLWFCGIFPSEQQKKYACFPPFRNPDTARKNQLRVNGRRKEEWISKLLDEGGSSFKRAEIIQFQDIYVRSLNTFNFDEFVTIGHQRVLDLSFSHKNYKKTIHVYF